MAAHRSRHACIIIAVLPDAGRSDPAAPAASGSRVGPIQEASISEFLSPTRLLSYWDRLRTSFWFLPSLMAGIALALSFGLIELDRWLGVAVVDDVTFLYTFGPEGARAILSTIASSMITVAGLTFSITMLTLQLASSQYGPRLLRNFMRDRGNQIVLGTFIATFVYCLLVLRTVRGVEGSAFVPHISVAFGVLLALASLGVLIYFIHHVASSIRIETLLTELATETHATIDRLYPERLGNDPHSDDPPPALPDFAAARPVFGAGSGYVQRIDVEALMELATEHDLTVRIEARPGTFVTPHDAIFRAHPQAHVEDDIADMLRGCFVVGQERTPEQDLEFSIHRVVEIAQRALSPGVNDPTTALYCIDRLREAFVFLADRDAPSALRVDDGGRLRVVTEVIAFDDLACPAFGSVGRYGIADADVAMRLLATIDSIAKRLSPDRRLALNLLRSQIRAAAAEAAKLQIDRERILAR